MTMSQDVCLCDVVEPILEKYNRDRGLLVSILQDIQEKLRYLPKEALLRVSKGLNVPYAQVYAVATFFKAFSLKPRGKIVCQVCTGTACHVRGAKLLVDKLERDLGVRSGETTSDLAYTIETVNCVGACALGPVVVINDDVHGHVTMQKLDSVLKRYRDTILGSSVSNTQPD